MMEVWGRCAREVRWSVAKSYRKLKPRLKKLKSNPVWRISLAHGRKGSLNLVEVLRWTELNWWRFGNLIEMYCTLERWWSGVE